jgi:ABC-type nickel/cobalt efflux system permease component RcnA
MSMEIDLTQAGLWTLLVATFTLAATHTVSPDHWFPFVMVGRANKWKTAWVLMLALLAGAGHVGTSVAIGLVGVFAEKGTSKEVAEVFEKATPLLLIVFGFGYAAYALYKQRVGARGHTHGIPIINKWLGINAHAYDLPGQEHSHAQDVSFSLGSRITIYLHKLDLIVYVAHDDHMHGYDATTEKDHEHKHYHAELLHEHKHKHRVKGIDGFVHSHGEEAGQQSPIDLKDKRAGWGLVAILGLTPCIALLPLTFTAVKYGTMAVILVNIAFTVGTLGTIVLFTWLGYLGLSWIKLDFFEKYGDVIAGAIIGLLGLATKIFEL